MNVPTPKAETIVHALDLVTKAHQARLSEPALIVAEKIARDEGASRAQVQLAVARGVQVLLACALLSSCRPAQAAVTPPTDTITTYVVPRNMRFPGATFAGYAQDGAEVWNAGDFLVRVRRGR